jgi:acyl-CoA thioester hydrolase
VSSARYSGEGRYDHLIPAQAGVWRYVAPVPGSSPKRSSTYRQQVRYGEADQQGVVFNMWYLGYFDEAMSHFLDEGGLPYRDLLDSGHDTQVVHTEIDWAAPLHWPDRFVVEVSAAATGTTSFTLSFEVSSEAGAPVATGSTVYVVVATDGSGKRPIPAPLRAALGTDA